MSAAYPHLVPSPEHAELCTEAITRVAKYLMLTPEAIRSHDRRPHVTLGRYFVMTVLSHAGLSPAQIARALELNHSTVLHGLARTAADPAHQALYRAMRTTFPASLRPRGEVTLEEEIRRVCLESNPPATPEEAAYVVALVTRRPIKLKPLAGYYGRRLLQERPDLADEVGRIVALFADIVPRREVGRPAPARVSYPLRGLELQR